MAENPNSTSQNGTPSGAAAAQGGSSGAVSSGGGVAANADSGAHDATNATDLKLKQSTGSLASPLVTLKPVEVNLLDTKQIIRNVMVQRREEGVSPTIHFDVLLQDEEKQEYRRFVLSQEHIKQVYMCRKVKQIVLKLDFPPLNNDESVATLTGSALNAPQAIGGTMFDSATAERSIVNLALLLRPDLEYETSNFLTLMSLRVHGGSKKREFFNIFQKMFEVTDISSDQVKEMLSKSDDESSVSSWHDALLNIGYPTLEKPLTPSDYLDSMDVARNTEVLRIMNRHETGPMQNPCHDGVVSDGAWKEWRSTTQTPLQNYIESYNSLNVKLTTRSKEKRDQLRDHVVDVFHEIDTSSDDEQNYAPDRSPTDNAQSSSRKPSTQSNNSLQNNIDRILYSGSFKGKDRSLISKIQNNSSTKGEEKKEILIVTMYHIFCIVESSIEQNGKCEVTTELYHDENISQDMNPIPIAEVAFMRLIPSKSIMFLVKKKAPSGKFTLEECKIFTPQADVVFNIVRRVYKSSVSVLPYLTREDFQVLPMIKPAIEYHTQLPSFMLDKEFRIKYESGGPLLSPMIPAIEMASSKRTIKRDSLPFVRIQRNSSEHSTGTQNDSAALTFEIAWPNSHKKKHPLTLPINVISDLVFYCRKYISVDPMKYKLESMASHEPSGNLLHQEAEDFCRLRFKLESKSNLSVVFSDYLLKAHDTENIISIEVDKTEQTAFIKLYESSSQQQQVIYAFNAAEKLKKINYYPGRKSVMWMKGKEQIFLTMGHCDRFVHHLEAVCSWCSHVDPFLVDEKTSYFHTVENDICNISLARVSFRCVSSIDREYVPYTMNYNLQNVRLAKHLFEFHDCRELHFSAFVDCKMLKTQTGKSTKQCLILCSDEDGNGVYFIVEYCSTWPSSDFIIHQRGYILSIVELTNPKGSDIEIAHDGMVFSLSFDYRQDMRLFFSVMQRRYSKVPIHTKTKLKLKQFESSIEVVIQKLMDAAQNSNIHDLSKYWFRFQYMYMSQFRHFWKSSQLNPFGLFSKDVASSSSVEYSEKKRRGHEALLYYGSLKEKLKILRDLKMIENYEALYDMEKRIYERTPLSKEHFEEVSQEYETLRQKIVTQEEFRVQSPQAKELLGLFTLKKRDINRIDYEHHSKNRSSATFGDGGLCDDYQKELDTSGIQLLLEDTFVRGIPVKQGDLPSERVLEQLSNVQFQLNNFRNETSSAIQWNLFENLNNVQRRIHRYIKKELSSSERSLEDHRILFQKEIDKINDVYHYYFHSTCSTDSLFSQVEIQIVKHDVEKAENIVKSFKTSLVHVKKVLIHLWEEFELELDEILLPLRKGESDHKGRHSPQNVNEKRLTLNEKIKAILVEHGDESRFVKDRLVLLSHANEKHKTAIQDLSFLETMISCHNTLHSIGKKIDRATIPSTNGEQPAVVEIIKHVSDLKVAHNKIVSSLEKANLKWSRIQWEKTHSAASSLQEELFQRDNLHQMIKDNSHYPPIVNFFKPIQNTLQRNIELILKRNLSVCTAVPQDGIQQLFTKLTNDLDRVRVRISDCDRDDQMLTARLPREVSRGSGTRVNMTGQPKSTLQLCLDLADDWARLVKRYEDEVTKFSSPGLAVDDREGNSFQLGPQPQIDETTEQFKQDIALLGQMLDENISTEHMTSYVHEIQKQSEPLEDNVDSKLRLSFRMPYARAEDLYFAHPAFHQRDLNLINFKDVWHGIQECLQFNSLEMGRLFAMLLAVPFEKIEQLFRLYYEADEAFVEEEQFTMQWPEEFQVAVALILRLHTRSKPSSQYDYKLIDFSPEEIAEAKYADKRGQMQLIKTSLMHRSQKKGSTPKNIAPGQRVMLSARSNHNRRSMQMTFQTKRMTDIASKSTVYFAHMLNFSSDQTTYNEHDDQDNLLEGSNGSTDYDRFNDCYAPQEFQFMVENYRPQFNWFDIIDRRNEHSVHDLDTFEEAITGAVESLEEYCRTTNMKNRKTNMCLVYSDNPRAFHLIETIAAILQQNMTSITSSSCMEFFCTFEHDHRVSSITRQYFEQAESANPMEAVMGTSYSDQHLPDFIKFLLEESFFSSFFHILLENRRYIFDKTSCLRADGKDDCIRHRRTTLVESIGREIDDMEFFLSTHVTIFESDDLERLIEKVGLVVRNTVQFFQEKFEDSMWSLQEAGREYVGVYSHISTIARQQLCPLLNAILQTAVPKSLLFGAVHVWKLVERACDPRDRGNIFMMNLKECLDTINLVSNSTATSDQKFEAFVCYALNQSELLDYFSIVLKNNALLSQHPDLRHNLLRYLAPLSPLPMSLDFRASVCALIWDEFKRGYDIKIHFDQLTLSKENNEHPATVQEHTTEKKFKSLRTILNKYTLSQLKAAAEESISRKNPLLSTWTAAATKAFHKGHSEWTIKILSCTLNSDIRVGITSLYESEKRIFGENEGDYAWSSLNGMLYYNGTCKEYSTKPESVTGFTSGDRVTVSVQSMIEVDGRTTIQVVYALNRKNLGPAFRIPLNRGQYSYFYPAVSLQGA
eukprot:CAMPEP_0117436898 /NCGR_PEP_ID=MMETSP0759-20121206/1243_1 /TAXON_ID=63605 /ORGANISM="Percolomonas cosmopolitus, Strain WS" /LENGTH=2506 /DNA_ID=CAMNT_0005228509 /DNA_START=265 /DNA_END=7782 /DNA_ORIENTATION=-